MLILNGYGITMKMIKNNNVIYYYFYDLENNDFVIKYVSNLEFPWIIESVNNKIWYEKKNYFETFDDLLKILKPKNKNLIKAFIRKTIKIRYKTNITPIKSTPQTQRSNTKRTSSPTQRYNTTKTPPTQRSNTKRTSSPTQRYNTTKTPPTQRYNTTKTPPTQRSNTKSTSSQTQRSNAKIPEEWFNIPDISDILNEMPQNIENGFISNNDISNNDISNNDISNNDISNNDITSNDTRTNNKISKRTIIDKFNPFRDNRLYKLYIENKDINYGIKNYRNTYIYDRALKLLNSTNEDSIEKIRKNFLKLQKKYHPDKCNINYKNKDDLYMCGELGKYMIEAFGYIKGFRNSS